MNKLIEDQLKKVTCADLSNFNKETNTYLIPKKRDIKIEQDKCYLIRLTDKFFNNETVCINWNSGKLPKFKACKVDVLKIMGKMIKVNCIGYDEETDEDLSYFWTGWIYLPDVEVIKKI